jgi:hypothetical protein
MRIARSRYLVILTPTLFMLSLSHFDVGMQIQVAQDLFGIQPLRYSTPTLIRDMVHIRFSGTTES